MSKIGRSARSSTSLLIPGTALAALGFALWLAPLKALGAEPAGSGSATNVSSTEASSPIAPAGSNGKSGTERNFYEVLEDLLVDFEYDLTNGNVQGIRDLAIRNIAASENIPNSFKNHLELVITERVLKTSRTKMIQCLACKAKRTQVDGDQVVISSTDTNPQELSRIAKMAGISNFMDVAFTYQPGGMVLSLTTIDPESGSIIWSRSYNSETSRASAFRRGVDFTQTDEARRSAEYKPTLQYRLGTYYMIESNVEGQTGCLGIAFRMMERYDNRRKEVGFEMNYLADATYLAAGSLTGGTTDPTTVNLYTGFNLTLLFMHSWNLIGTEENYNQIRHNIFTGVGGTYSSGFLGGLLRAGYEARLAKHWAVNATFGYRPAAKAFLAATEIGSVSGIEAGLGVNYLF